MSRQPQSNLEFVETFVDALTVRPFLNDLRRTRRSKLQLAALLANADQTELHEDTANAA